MRILFLNQFFWPDAAPTGRLLGDLCEALASQGHEVEVLCGQPDYEAQTDAPPPSVLIHRIRNLGYSRSRVRRLLSWGSFLMLATLRSLWLPRYDLVVTMTSPPALSFAGWLNKRLRGSAFWIWEMDLYPDIAIATGVWTATSLTARVLSTLMDWPRRRADGVIVPGECMRERLLTHGIAPGRIHVAENWVDGTLIQATPIVAAPPYTILYSGNLGLAHEIHTIFETMVVLRDDPQFRFVFAGGGAHYTQLKDLCQQRGLVNVEFLGYESTAQFSERLADCQIGLVTLRSGCEGTVVPSKVYSLMAAGRPYLFIGPSTATPACRTRKFGCGWHRDAGDVTGTVDLLRSLVPNSDLLRIAAAKARTAFDVNFERTSGAARISKLLTGGVGTREK